MSISVERVEIEVSGSPWSEEHLSRYFFKRNLFTGKHVADIACGTGFGSVFIAKSGAEHVYAVDVYDEAIESTILKAASYSNVSVYKGDGRNIPLADGSIDIICSFETIEHIEDYPSFLSELHRVLKPGGILIISTPNASVTNPEGGKPKNPFHVKEFLVDELINILKNWFSVSESLGQHVVKSYGIAPFLPSFSRKNLSFVEHLSFIYWRILLRLPHTLRNSIHKLIYGHAFYPVIEDYTFHSNDLYKAHVQVHICIKRES